MVRVYLIAVLLFVCCTGALAQSPFQVPEPEKASTEGVSGTEIKRLILGEALTIALPAQKSEHVHISPKGMIKRVVAKKRHAWVTRLRSSTRRVSHNLRRRPVRVAIQRIHQVHLVRSAPAHQNENINTLAKALRPGMAFVAPAEKTVVPTEIAKLQAELRQYKATLAAYENSLRAQSAIIKKLKAANLRQATIIGRMSVTGQRPKVSSDASVDDAHKGQAQVGATGAHPVLILVMLVCAVALVVAVLYHTNEIHSNKTGFVPVMQDIARKWGLRVSFRPQSRAKTKTGSRINAKAPLVLVIQCLSALIGMALGSRVETTGLMTHKYKADDRFVPPGKVIVKDHMAPIR